MAESGSSADTSAKLAHDDHLKRECDKLNKEIEKLLEETRSREKYSITIIAGVASWGLAQLKEGNQHILPMISWIPIITTITFGLSVFFLYRNIIWIGSYLEKLEGYFLGENELGFGWEKYFKKANKFHWFVITTILMWLIQLGAAIVFCWYMHR